MPNATANTTEPPKKSPSRIWMAISLAFMFTAGALFAHVAVLLPIDFRYTPTVSIPDYVDTCEELEEFIYESYPFLENYHVREFTLWYNQDMELGNSGGGNGGYLHIYFINTKGIFSDLVCF